MNKSNLYILLTAFLCLTFIGCDKELETHLEYPSYSYETVDQDGGQWIPVLLSSSADIIIDEPSDIASSEYLAELENLKSESAELTDEERENVMYWTNNPTNRWNEIALELIAKYNLIPGPNEDGSYTLPNPNNPGGTPPFPFAHPPYACRALAYLSVAQFDGLISAWHYKYLYNRQAPYKVDADISFAYVDNGIPSYPSDGAVIARASRKILTAMFPLEEAYLEEMEQRHLESLLHSGSNVQSDLDAGVYIGDEVATMALERASTDGMSSAQAPKAVSDSIKAAAFDRFGWQWDNLELPVRPVGLTPLFGKVRMWSIDNVESVRPVAPPDINSQEVLDDIELLKDYADNVTEETRSIANFWQDGLGTYTPPGHWNRIAKEIIVEENMNPLRTARTYAYLNMAMMDGGISCWDAKYYYHYPRPIQLIDGFETIAGTPNFPSYTSGHSVFSAAGAAVLSYIFPEREAILNGWAEEAAISRVYGGIHWTFDATVGTDQGREVASYVINMASADGAQ